MINEAACNSLAITDLLYQHHPAIANAIAMNCSTRNIAVTIIRGANDYWCRDFMPLQVAKGKYVQFRYDPSYYKCSGYYHLKTEITNLSFRPSAEIKPSVIILDGGTISHYGNKAIVTDKIFKDNTSYTKNELIDTIAELLDLDEITIIPTLPYDITGHADGMIKYVNDDTLLLNDLSLISSKTYRNKLFKALKKYNLVELPNDLHKNLEADDATGDYMNMTIIRDILFVPVYNNATDELAQRIITSAFPSVTIVPIESKELASKAGILHCATWNYLE